jgi:hypothetical protein
LKYLYHPTEARKGRLFADDANPEGWHDTPAAFGVITCPSQEQLAEMAKEAPAEASEGVELADMSKDELLALAEQRGIDVDKRLGVEKLRAVLNGDSP